LDTATSATTSVTTNTLSTGAALAIVLVVWLFVLIITIFFIACLWRIFTKAGKPGWASIIPIYNYIILLEIIERPIWWIVLFFIPIANVVVQILIALELAEAYGKSTLFGVLGLMFFPIVGYPMLAFGSAKYVGKAGTAGSAPAGPAAPAAPMPPAAPTPPPAV
jgi:hypothetical protein